jgi:ABC-2 type transport system permease protein
MLYAALMAASGAMSRDAQENTQIASVWLLFAALPFFFIGSIGADPGSWIARLLTWVPLTAPVALLLRMGSGAVPPVEVAGASVLMLATLAATVAGSAALLRARMLAGSGAPLRWRRVTLRV